MNRINLAYLQKWMDSSNRKPLILRGARQVGKSTLVRLFSQKVQKNLVEINLELHKDLDSVFQSLNIELILQNLEHISSSRINKDSLLFLDEIQAAPHALAALRYFYEQKAEIPVIAAGSLLEFTLKDHSFSMPVGRIQYLHQGPMSFLEFLEALDPFLHDYLTNHVPGDEILATAHENLLKRQREFMLTGGMPEAVKVYRDSNSFEEVKAVHESICNTYIDDFSKYAGNRELADLQQIFRSIPRQIGRKVKYVQFLPDAKSAYTRGLLEMLHNARLINKVYAADLNGVPIAAGINQKNFKLIFLDTGLLSTILGIDLIELQNTSERELMNEGFVAEQYVGQLLFNSDFNNIQSGTYYWLRESSKSNAKVDFAVSKGSVIYPIEVKSGKSGTLKSLHQLMYEKELKLAFRFDLQPPSRQEINTKISTKSGIAESKYTLISLPLYCVELLPRFMEALRTNPNE